LSSARQKSPSAEAVAAQRKMRPDLVFGVNLCYTDIYCQRKCRKTAFSPSLPDALYQ